MNNYDIKHELVRLQPKRAAPDMPFSKYSEQLNDESIDKLGQFIFEDAKQDRYLWMICPMFEVDMFCYGLQSYILELYKFLPKILNKGSYPKLNLGKLFSIAKNFLYVPDKKWDEFCSNVASSDSFIARDYYECFKNRLSYKTRFAETVSYYIYTRYQEALSWLDLCSEDDYRYSKESEEMLTNLQSFVDYDVAAFDDVDFRQKYSSCQ